MESRNNILSELHSISPVIAEIVPQNPYSLPPGYFEGFATKILDLVKEQTPSTVLIDITQNPYQEPQGYFEKFPEQILQVVKKEEVSVVLKNASTNPYETPQGYFEGLADRILSHVKENNDLTVEEELETLSPLLSKLDKKNPYATPTGYFEELTGNVVTGLKAIDFVNGELENVSPLMNDLKRENVYTVPPQYFENFLSNLLIKVKERKPAKVVSMNFSRKAIMRYAAAAGVAGIIFIAGLLFLNKQDSSVVPGTIVKAQEKIQLETQNRVKGLSDDEIMNFIEDQNAPLPDFLSMTSSEIDSDDVKLMLADVPDAELNQYLVEYSDAKDVLTN